MSNHVHLIFQNYIKLNMTNFRLLFSITFHNPWFYGHFNTFDSNWQRQAVVYWRRWIRRQWHVFSAAHVDGANFNKQTSGLSDLGKEVSGSVFFAKAQCQKSLAETTTNIRQLHLHIALLVGMSFWRRLIREPVPGRHRIPKDKNTFQKRQNQRSIQNLKSQRSSPLTLKWPSFNYAKNNWVDANWALNCFWSGTKFVYRKT